MKYRPDIDGLRAIAIIPVVLFHAGFDLFSGGYVGVDIFFVISGYLITKVICDDISGGGFSYAVFYERRIRRIFPALFAVSLFTAVLAAVLLLPDDLALFGKSLLATVVFASNIFFYKISGYFSPNAELMPLLHTWSLAVEEQFYIVAPIVLAVSFRLKLGWRVVIAAGLVASLALSAYSVEDYATATFYLLPTRAWELLAGSLVAVGGLPVIRNRAVAEGLSLLGLGLILYAIFAYDHETVFPGPAAVLPVLGAALLIYAGPARPLASRLLSTRPFVGIGLISYSLYLWHWPLIVFSNYYLIEPMTPVQGAAVVVASLLAGYLSWRFVEAPFRRPPKGSRLASRRTIFALAWAGGAFLIGGSLVLWLNSGFPGRVSPQVIAIAAAADDTSPFRQKCHVKEARRFAPGEVCVFPGDLSPDRPIVAVIGDSHAVELSYALAQALAARDIGVAQLSSSACPAMLGEEVPRVVQCLAQNDERFRYVIDNPRIRDVVLVGYYQSVIGKIGAERYYAALERAVSALTKAGKRVIIEGPILVPGVDHPLMLARATMFGRLAEVPALSGAPAQSLDEIKTALATIAGRTGAEVYYPDRTLCQDGTCAFIRDGMSLYFDSYHLTMSATHLVAPGLAGLIGTQAVEGL